jgi:hypothetical protein
MLPTQRHFGYSRLCWIFAICSFRLLADPPVQDTLGAATAPSSSLKAVAQGSAAERSFEEWRTACTKLPSNRSAHGRLPSNDLLPLKTFGELRVLIDAFFEQCKTGALARTNLWLDELPTSQSFFNTTTGYFLVPETARARTSIRFQPFAQKLSLPAGAEVFFHADYHGDVRSFIENITWLNDQGYLQGFKIARPDFYMIFLGDYTDRGAYGVEVLYTLFRLKLANPDRVFMARGNHEEASLQARYGFLAEGKSKYGREFDGKHVIRAYDFLPVVIYLGVEENFIQCNHAGMEPGYDPRRLLATPGTVGFQFLGTLYQRRFFDQHPEWYARADSASRELASQSLRDFLPDDPIYPSVLGFMWNDFSVLPTDPQFAIDPGRAYIYGEQSTQFLLRSGSTENQALHAVFRGHQHSSVINPMMRRLIASRGVFRHWQRGDSKALLNAKLAELEKVLERSEERPIPTGSVWTFNVSPDSAYGEGSDYNFDSFGIVKTAPKFSDWRMRVINLPIQP